MFGTFILLHFQKDERKYAMKNTLYVNVPINVGFYYKIVPLFSILNRRHFEFPINIAGSRS